MKRLDPKAPRLAFRGTFPDFTPGRLYMSVRVGGDWTRRYLNGCESVVLLDGDGKPRGTAEIQTVCYLPMMEIPAAWLLRNYYPVRHTHAGLLAGLRECYPQDDVQSETDVSVIWFVVDEPENLKFKEYRSNG